MIKFLVYSSLLSAILAVSLVAVFGSLYRSSFLASDFGVFENRKKFEYTHIHKHENSTPALKFSLDEQVASSDNLESYVLPTEQEEVDDRLFEILEGMEGDNSNKTYYKGLMKGIITQTGIDNMGGGSNLVITTAGNLLNDYSEVNKDNKILFRIYEIRLANYIQSLEKNIQKQIILSQSCLVGNTRGCTTASVLMFNKLKPTTDRERLILGASIRYPITEGNKEKLAIYTNQKCHSLKNTKNIDIGECNITTSDFKQKINIGDIRLTGAIAPFCKGAVEFFPQKQTLADKVKKIVNTMNADVELSVFKYTQKDNKVEQSVLARCSNNELIARNGFNEQNIASTAKLFLLLSKNNLPESTIQAMQNSANEEIEKIAKNHTSYTDIEIELRAIGINPKYHNDFIGSMSFGNISMNSDDLHKLLFSLPKYGNTPIKKKSMNSALNGTLSYLKTNAKSNGLNLSNILVAKSGTYAIRQPDQKLKEGIHGSLAIFGLKYKNEYYTMVVRMHSKQDKATKEMASINPICAPEQCTKDAVQELVDAGFYIINNQPKSK